MIDYKGFTIEAEVHSEKLKAIRVVDGNTIEICGETVAEVKKKIDKHNKTSFKKVDVYDTGNEGCYNIITLTSFNADDRSFYSVNREGRREKIRTYEFRESIATKTKENLERLKKIKVLYRKVNQKMEEIGKIEKTLERFKIPKEED